MTTKSLNTTQVEQYLKQQNILYKYQSGFRKSYSTDTCLIHLTTSLSPLDLRPQAVLLISHALRRWTGAFKEANMGSRKVITVYPAATSLCPLPCLDSLFLYSTLVLCSRFRVQGLSFTRINTGIRQASPWIFSRHHQPHHLPSRLPPPTSTRCHSSDPT